MIKKLIFLAFFTVAIVGCASKIDTVESNGGNEKVRPDKFDEYTDVLNRLVSEAVSCTPQNWTHGTLKIETDGNYINYSLKNESEAGKASISENLKTLIDELYIRMSSHGDSWSEATVKFQINGENVKFSTDFNYNK